MPLAEQEGVEAEPEERVQAQQHLCGSGGARGGSGLVAGAGGESREQGEEVNMSCDTAQLGTIAFHRHQQLWQHSSMRQAQQLANKKRRALNPLPMAVSMLLQHTQHQLQ